MGTSIVPLQIFMINYLKRLHQDNSGIALMLFAIILPVFLLLGVLIIDGGNLFGLEPKS